MKERAVWLLAVGTVGAAIVGVGAVRQAGRPAGVIRDLSCVVHGTSVVVSGVVVNQTMSTHGFVLSPRLSLDGGPVASLGSSAVYGVEPLGVRAWKEAAVDLVTRRGTAITACALSVSLPSSND